MNYTITQAIKKLSNHSTTDDYFNLCRLIRDGIIHTCFDVYGVAVAVVEETNKPLPNKEVIGIRFLNESDNLMVTPNRCYKNAICDLILDKIDKVDIPLVRDSISNKYDYVLLKGVKIDNIHLITTQLKDWHIIVENPVNLSEDTYTQRQTTVRDLERFNIFASFTLTKLSLLISKQSLDTYLDTLNVNKTKKKTVSDSYVEAKKLVEDLSNKCWQADSNQILTKSLIAEKIKDKLKGSKYEYELPQRLTSLEKKWIAPRPETFKERKGKPCGEEKTQGIILLNRILELDDQN
jgi:hypothetical protein